jgi:hypothetical protein
MDAPVRFFLDHGGKIHVMNGFDECVGTAEHLIALAREGQLSKSLLAALLETDVRPRYLNACAEIERRFTEACAAKNDPCLASGCSVDGVEGEACLQPLLSDETEYQKACAAAWVSFFADPRNRIPAWQRDE